MFFQKDIETLSREEIEKIQLERLKHQVQYCMDNVPFYHKRLTEAGVTADKIKTLSDIQYIPYTTKTDIRDNYPFGLFAKPMKEIVRIHASSGTTGKPTVVGYTRNDLNNWSDCVARLCAAVGVHDGDIAQISFGYGLFTGALGLHYGLEKLGCAVIPISSGNTQKQAMILKDFGTSVLISTPSYAMYMSEVAHEMGISNDELKLRIGLFGSEGCTDALRDKIEKGFGLFSTDNYGMSELMGPGVSGECEYRCGLHFAEDHFLPEVINSETGEVLPRGEKGELVVTTLTKEGIPLLRYRTKDITRIHYEKCKCGRTHARMEKVQGRSDDMLKIRGVNVFPSQIESVMANIEGISPHYELILTRKNYTDYLEVRIEIIDESLLEKLENLEKLQKEAADKLKTVLGIQAKVTLVAPKSIQRYEGKAKRIIDKRNECEE
ncbi:MAG: phenylacetate--CoA ligase [Oscillospiraceae bacterium]|nr:phenylacetate--CoA ligase [Oscillospiraceae bacterium]MBR7084814.1 phenylacetate--CoA ligase [Oscillospiraceae bacterium]